MLATGNSLTPQLLCFITGPKQSCSETSGTRKRSLYSFQVDQLKHFITATEGTQQCPVSVKKAIHTTEGEEGLL